MVNIPLCSLWNGNGKAYLYEITNPNSGFVAD